MPESASPAPVINLHFSDALLHWNATENQRQMPWKNEKDPYKIWLSEIILQQTRVDQGLNYYNNFLAAFPTVQALAAAPDVKIFKLWEGLGYYTRCKNLIATARHVVQELNGIFPTTYAGLLNLKGIGPYTAAAIASFAYNLPYAVLDGNVFRVLARITNTHTPMDTNAGKKTFSVLAQSLLPGKKAGIYNQAIMDFGALICKPKPLCSHCFFNYNCAAYRVGTQNLLPVKEKKLPARERWFNYVVLTCNGKVLVQQRTEKDIWQQLFQFVLIETKQPDTPAHVLAAFSEQYDIEAGHTPRYFTPPVQKLTHQRVHFQFILVEVAAPVPVAGFRWVNKKQLQKLAFPKTLKTFALQHLL